MILHYISRLEKQLWFGEYCQWVRSCTICYLLGEQPLFPVDF